jgi:hypothetical protein
MSDTVNTVRHETGNTKKPSRSRAWCFTLNNYTEEDIKFFASDTVDTVKYIFQEETGENGTPHLQGMLYFDNARTFDQMKQIHSKVHWEKTKCIKGSINYCCKQETRTGQVYYKGWIPPKEIKLISNFYPWQQKIIDLVNTEPDERTIEWFWEPEGCKGKTALTKYLLVKKPRVHFFSGGCAKDIAFQIINESWEPDVCIFNFPRTSEGAVSYNALEMLKDGIVQTGKYKGGRRIFNSPHVIVFANWQPNLKALSADRWRITRL